MTWTMIHTSIPLRDVSSGVGQGHMHNQTNWVILKIFHVSPVQIDQGVWWGSVDLYFFMCILK